jgi:hypothetical protein
MPIFVAATRTLRLAREAPTEAMARANRSDDEACSVDCDGDDADDDGFGNKSFGIDTALLGDTAFECGDVSDAMVSESSSFIIISPAGIGRMIRPTVPRTHAAVDKLESEHAAT